MKDLTALELDLLEVQAKRRPPLPWGAAIGEAFEFLLQEGYVHRTGEITASGLAILQHHRPLKRNWRATVKGILHDHDRLWVVHTPEFSAAFTEYNDEITGVDRQLFKLNHQFRYGGNAYFIKKIAPAKNWYLEEVKEGKPGEERKVEEEHVKPKLRVYTASKLAQAPRWNELRAAGNWPCEFSARWPYAHVGLVPDEAAFAQVFWTHDLEDVASSDVILVYAEPGEHLRGALVEAGMGIALGKTIIVVGDHDDYGTWRYHPQVLRVANLEEAKTLLSLMSS